ncbi:bacteriohopanetetrol glucosamine biosynthesis glycosyltransferase HpnI [Caballeronia sp. Lep1P3]|uniref:bacteriohopanetetrol glucosamine biosynthesis glycosyltransferase HpnI n=1 Tax=Caballeronia sp. Lep1P3 TaxID=2878150 RepID=UPI001FD204AC|nr:bacteriohopanetetrol glucosamine biosynthesis glycosyltransferase HpnI [Caballeronia sp. Lep1P3]
MSAHSVGAFLWLVIALCGASTCYIAIAALVHAGARGMRRVPVDIQHDENLSSLHMPVSVLKPLCGAEPRLYWNLESFCTQAHPSYQLVFGVASADDAAASVVRRLIQAYPERDIALVVNAEIHGTNLKVSNLLNLIERARHEWLVIADSDISVGPDYLTRVTAPLADARIGLVTCLYRARCVGGFWSRLGGLFIDEWFAPSVDVANLGGYGRFGFGATLALSREMLEQAGGFEALRDCLADDYWLADRVRACGKRTVLSGIVVTTDVIENRFAPLWHRETRWLRTIRSVNPAGFLFLCLTLTSPWLLTSALIGVSLDTSGADLVQSIADTIVDTSTSLGLSARLLLHWRCARSWRHFWWNLPLIPLRDALMCVQWFAALFGSNVNWRGARVPIGDVRDAYRAEAPVSDNDSL